MSDAAEVRLLTGTSPERLRQELERARAEGRRYLCAFTGRSMIPTLRLGDTIEVAPADPPSLRVGDVLLFRPSEQASLCVHRVVRREAGGLRTRGDGNNGEDWWLLEPDAVQGRVVAVWRGDRRRRLPGGWYGLLWHYVTRLRRRVRVLIATLLRPAYHRLGRSGWLRQLPPASLRPRAVQFARGERREMRLLCGRRIVGSYNPYSGQWGIRWPYRLFVNAEALPRPKGAAHAQQRPGADSRVESEAG